jgi:hypothetical protein
MQGDTDAGFETLTFRLLLVLLLGQLQDTPREPLETTEDAWFAQSNL